MSPQSAHQRLMTENITSLHYIEGRATRNCCSDTSSVKNSTEQVPLSPAVGVSPLNGSMGFKSPPLSEGGGTVPSEFYDAEEDRSEGSGHDRRRISLFAEDPFSDGAAISESIKASETAGPLVSNIQSLSSPEATEQKCNASFTLVPRVPDQSNPTTPTAGAAHANCKSSSSSTSSEPEIRPIQRVMSSPVGGVVTKTKSAGSSPLGALRSPMGPSPDSPAPTPARDAEYRDIPEESPWPHIEPFELTTHSTTTVVKHKRLVACDFDESEVLDEGEISRFMGAEGELCSTDTLGGPACLVPGFMPSHLSAPITLVTPLPYDYSLMMPRAPLRMETVFEEHEENTSLIDKEKSNSSRTSSSSSSNMSIENDRLKFEDMLGLRVEKINIESSIAASQNEKQPLSLSRPTSESQQTEVVKEHPSHRWGARLRGRLSRRFTISRKDSCEHASQKCRRGSGSILIERLIGRRDAKASALASHGGLSGDMGMTTAAQIALFPRYLKYNQNGWIRIPVKSRQDASERTSKRPISPCKGFESVWLIDKDDTLVGLKEWMNSYHQTPMVDVYQTTTPATSPTTSLSRPNRRGRGTQTPIPPPATDSAVTGGPIWCLALSRDGKYLAAGSRKGYIYVWELSEVSDNHAFGERYLRRKGGFAGHTGGVIAMHWSGKPHSYVLVSCAVDKTVRLWTLNCDTTLAILRCSSVPVGTLFTKTQVDDQIVVAGLDGSVKLVNLTPAPSSFRSQNPNEPPPVVNCEAVASFNFAEAITSLSISPDGRYLTCGMQYGSVTIHNLESGMVEKQIECRNRRGKHAKGEKITGIDWSQNLNGDFICVTARDSRIRVISIKDETQQLKLKGSDIRLKAFFDPGSRFVIGVTEVNRVAIWDLLEASSIMPSCTKKGSLRLSSNHNRRSDAETFKTSHNTPLLKSQITSLTDSVSEAVVSKCEASNLPGVHHAWVSPLPADVKKRPTASAVGSFKVPENAITALLVTAASPDEPSDGCRPVQIICGTTTGSLHVFMALLTP